MNRKLTTFSLLCGLAAMTGMPVMANDDEHWTKSTPYYEQEAWWDVTEWFDGNDYARVDADEVNDNDNDNDEDYASTTYGYDDRYDADDWYYDYYDTGMYSFGDWDSDGFYDSYSRYYDYDGDGFYDAYYASYDYNDDGLYDDYTFYSFNDKANGSSRTAQANSTESSKRQMVAGTIQKTKTVSVQDTKHMVVELKKDKGGRCLIDLGAASDLSDMDLEDGDQISAQGPVTKVGERKVLIAQKLVRGNETHEIDRSSRDIKGTISETRTAKVRGREHQMIVLKSDKKNRLVDLGPADGLSKLNLEKGKQISVQGPRIQVNDRTLILAQQVSQGEESLQVNRQPKNSKQSVSQR